MRKEVIEIEVEADGAISEIEKLQQSVDKLNDKVQESSEETKDSLNEVKKVSKTTAGAVKGIGLALKAIGIGLILKAFQLFTDILAQNQKVVDFGTTAFNFLSLAVNDLIENVSSVIGWFKKLGSAVSAVFKGQFGLAAAIVQDATNDLIEYTDSVIEAAKETTELANRAAIAAAKNRGLVEEYDRQAERLRQIRDDESRTIEDRIQANIDLGVVLEQQERAMLRNADIVLRSAQAEFNRNKTIENEVALIEAKNEKLAVLAQIEGFRSEQLVNENSLIREKLDLQRQEAELRDKESQDLEAWLEEQEQIETDAEDRRINNEHKASQERIKNAQAEADAKVAIQLMLKAQISNALTSISQLFEQGTAASKAAALAEVVIGTGLGFIQGLDIAQKSAKGTGPLAAFAFPVFYATQIAAVLGAVGKAKNILSQVKGGGNAGGVSAPSIPQPRQIEAQSPDFNIVGSSGTNQLASAIGGQTQQPVQAFVVTNDVTTGQSMDRNIIDSATVG